MSENEEISKLTQLKEKLFPSIGKEIPTGVSKQIHKNLAMFVGGGIFLLIFLLAVQAWEFLYMAVGIILFGLYISLYIYHLALTDKIREIEGVVIEKERSGYRKQKLYLYIQTPKHAVYRILVTESGRKYKEGNIVRFYSVANALNNLQDGVNIVSSVYAVERLSAKVTSDEEDAEVENVLRQENSEAEQIQQRQK
jgi:hypothetical protein